MLLQFISSQQGRIRDHLPEYITIDPELTEDENEERWWTHHWGLVRQDMRAAYPGVSDQVFDGLIHDLYRAHHHDRHDRSYRSQRSHNRSANYVFEDMYPEFDIAYVGGESILHHEERNELRRIIFGDSEHEPMGHEISRETLRNYAVRLTRLGIMNVRFRGPGSPGDYGYMIRMVYFAHQEYRDFPHVGSIVAAIAAIPWDDNDPEEEVERAHKAARTNREAHDMWAYLQPPFPSEVPHMANPPAVAEADKETTGAKLFEPAEDSVPPLKTPPYPGQTHQSDSHSCISLNPYGIITATDPVAMALGQKKPKPDCFYHYTLDNHVDICIFCNAGLLTNICPSEFRVNGIGNSNIQFDQVGDHPYCGTVIYAPTNRYKLIAMRVIKDNGHRYVTD
jgi:hypothetical protein